MLAYLQRKKPVRVVVVVKRLKVATCHESVTVLMVHQ